MSKIALCAIAYNAEKILPTLLKSVKGHVDHVVLGIDSKTTDDTRGVIQRWSKKAKVPITLHDFVLEDEGTGPAGPKNFHRARNENWALIPKDCDWAIWLDTDDEFHADVDLHKIADEAPENVTQVWMEYAYYRDAYGNVTTDYWRERLIRVSAGRKWVRRLHEILVTDPPSRIDEKRAWVEHVHRTDEPEKGVRNFTTLKKILEEDPGDEWATMYMGMQLFGALHWEEAAQHLLRFVRMTKDIGERWQALVMAAKAYRSAGKNQESLNASVGAIREIPGWADPYYEMAYTYQALEEWGRAIQWYEEALKRDIPDDRRLLKNPLDYDFNPGVTLHTSYAVMGDLEKARALLDQAIAIRPEPELVRVRGLYDRTISKREAITAGLSLASHLFRYGEPQKAKAILAALPAGSDRETRTVGQTKVAIAHETAFADSDNAFENHYFLDEESAAPKESEPTLEEKWLLERLQKAGAERVLDIGIGNAQTALYLAANGIHVVGLDIDPRRVKKANLEAVKRGYLVKRYAKVHARSVPVMERHRRGCAPPCAKREHLIDAPAQFWYGRAEKIPEKVKALGPYDAVLLDGVLNRVRDHEAAIKSAEGLTSRVLITVPDGSSIHTEHPKGTLRAFDPFEIESAVIQRGRLVESHALSETLYAAEYTAGIDADAPPVAIFCGPGWEPWTPDQIDGKGLGGSETAVVKLAEELVGRGMRVMVYAEAEGTWNGVNYRRYDKWNPRAPVFMFIAWRQPGVFDQQIAAEQAVLWMHDTDSGDMLTEERGKKMQSVWVMSRWHRSHLLQKYPFLTDEQLVVVGNGIDPARFDQSGQTGQKDNMVIYSSSPDRGLEEALTYWPDIREKTGAELHVFYGWETWDKMGGDVRLPGYKKKIMDLAKQDGVVWRGRVGQRNLGQELMKAKVLFYPGPHEFHETFCITALEAQAAGCIPVTRDNGALPETNKHGIVLPNDSKPSRWVAAVQEALTAPDHDRSKMREWALRQTWGAVAERVIDRSIALDKTKQLQESKSA